MIDPTKQYVLGFLFNINTENVALIRKKKPDWQAGKLNGIGGKIEPTDLTPEMAMEREFCEETGCRIADYNWRRFATLGGHDDVKVDGKPWRVYCFYSETTFRLDELLRSTTDEEVVIRPIDQITGLVKSYDALPNLHWLIPMALSMGRERAFRFEILEHYQ